jgi:hypothetical protein
MQEVTGSSPMSAHQPPNSRSSDRLTARLCDLRPDGSVKVMSNDSRGLSIRAMSRQAY